MLKDIQAQIAALREQEKALLKDEAARVRELAKAVVMRYDYTAVWTHPAQCQIERKLTPESRAEVDAFNEEHGPGWVRPFEGGITYSILEGGYAVSSGGNVIVKFINEDHWGSTPVSIKPKHLASLREGIVPDEIKTA